MSPFKVGIAATAMRSGLQRVAGNYDIKIRYLSQPLEHFSSAHVSVDRKFKSTAVNLPDLYHGRGDGSWGE